MKRLITSITSLLFTFLLIVTPLWAQNPPQAISYQAVARDAGGLLMSNQNIDIRFSVREGTPAGTNVYVESHNVTTNDFGLMNLAIGTGTASTGIFMDIDWSANDYFLNVKIDAGSGFVNMGTPQLLSVPYALQARFANKSTNMKIDDLKDVELSTPPALGELLKWDGSDFVPGTDDNTSFWAQNGSNINYSSGFVGIGTASPDELLSIHNSSGTSYIRVSNNITGLTSGLRMGLSGSGHAFLINDQNTTLNLGTDGSSQLHIDENGHIGINTTAIGQMLHITQDISNKALRIQHQSTTDYWENGIGVTTKNYKFYYNNLFRADISSVDGSYTQSSDRRLKQDIQNMEPVLERVIQLKPATYRYIGHAHDAPRSSGFVAQEVEQLFPELVRDLDDGYKGLVYDGFAVISIKAIQELTEKMEEMQAEIDELKQAVGDQ